MLMALAEYYFNHISVCGCFHTSASSLCFNRGMPLSHYSKNFHSLLKTAKTHKLDRGDTVVTSDKFAGIFCIESGFAKRFHIKNDGSISVQGIYGPGDCFGITVLSHILIKGNTYRGNETYYYEAVTPIVVHEIAYEKLRFALSRHPSLYKDLFAIQGWHSISDIWRLENQSLDNSTKRVAHIICFYMERYGQTTKKGLTFRVPLIQQDLADILDLTRETVSIAISELRQQGYVTGSRTIHVPDLSSLQEYAYS